MFWIFDKKNCLCNALTRLLPFLKLDTLVFNPSDFPGAGSMENFSRSISDDDDEESFPDMNGRCSSNEDIMDRSSSSEDIVIRGENEGGGDNEREIDIDIDALLNRCRNTQYRSRLKPLEEGM